MATFAKIVLDTRKNSKKDDGTFPIILRLWHQGSNRTILSLGYYATKDDWEASTQTLLKSYKLVTNLTRTNNYLIKKRIIAFDVINELKDSNEIETITINELNQFIRERIAGKEPAKKLRKTKERKPLEFKYCKETYLKYLNNIDVPMHKQRKRDPIYLKNTKMYLERFEEFLQNREYHSAIKNLNRVTDKIVGAYYEHVDKNTSSNPSFNHHFKAVRTFYNFLIDEKEYQIVNPIKKVALRYEATMPKSISKDDFDALLNIISPTDSVLEYKKGVRKNMYKPYLKFAFQLALYTGRRTEEIVSFKWNKIKCDTNGEPLYIESIDLKANRQSNFNQSKMDKIVFIPVIPQLKELLYDMGFEKHKDTDNYLIADDDQSSRKSIVNNLSKSFTFYYRRLNTGKEISLKHLRKTYLTHLQIITGNAIGISGHSTEAILDNHYIDQIEIAKSVAKSSLSILGS